MKESLRMEDFFSVSPETLYTSWLESETHSAMTGAEAKIDPKVGGAFTAWDGYIEGKNIELVPNKKIVQEWRTTEFADDDENSRLEILLEPEEGGTKLTLIHTHIPEGQKESYEQGWNDYYFQPMKEFFV